MKKIRCWPCGGSGIYRGLAETFGPGGDEGGYAVVCRDCDGNGFKEVSETGPKDVLFTERVVRAWCTQVGVNGNSLVPAQCEPVSYADFLAGQRPGPPKEFKNWRQFGEKGEIA